MEHSTPILQPAFLFLLSAVIGLFLWTIKRQVNRIEGKTDNALTVEHCKGCHEETKKARAEQWNVINHHGHRGLKGEDNDVVRC